MKWSRLSEKQYEQIRERIDPPYRTTVLIIVGIIWFSLTGLIYLNMVLQGAPKLNFLLPVCTAGAVILMTGILLRIAWKKRLESVDSRNGEYRHANIVAKVHRATNIREYHIITLSDNGRFMKVCCSQDVYYNCITGSEVYLADLSGQKAAHADTCIVLSPKEMDYIAVKAGKEPIFEKSNRSLIEKLLQEKPKVQGSTCSEYSDSVSKNRAVTAYSTTDASIYHRIMPEEQSYIQGKERRRVIKACTVLAVIAALLITNFISGNFVDRNSLINLPVNSMQRLFIYMDQGIVLPIIIIGLIAGINIAYGCAAIVDTKSSNAVCAKLSLQEKITRCYNFGRRYRFEFTYICTASDTGEQVSIITNQSLRVHRGDMIYSLKSNSFNKNCRLYKINTRAVSTS